MSKLNLNDIVNPDSAAGVINTNSQRIEDEFDKVLYRDGTQPNAMLSNLDMNGYRVTNLPDPVSDAEPVRKGRFDLLEARADQMDTQVANAAASAASAAASAAAAEAAFAEDGTIILGNVAFTQSGAGAKTRTVTDKLKDWLSAADFGTTTAALQDAATEAMASGKKLIIPRGNYTLTTTLGFGNIVADIEVICETGARFIAGSGFPVGKLVQFTGGAGRKIIWRGGEFDGENMPNSGPGEANDILSFNLAGADLLLVEDVTATCGAEFTSAGSDSCIFAGWARRMIMNRISVRGAPDSGIYLSGGSTGDGSSEFSEELSVDDLTANACSNGLIIKRRFRRVNIGRVYLTDCGNGVAIGAEASFGDGSTDLEASDIDVGSIIARRTGAAVLLRFTDNARVGSVISRDMGCKIGTYTDTIANAVLMQGAQRSHIGSVIADGENSTIASLASRAVRLQSRTIDGVTRHSTHNTVGPITAQSIDRTMQEDDASQTNNIYQIAREISVATMPSALGTGSIVQQLSAKAPRIVAQSAVPASVTGTTAETTLATIPIAGRSMGPNGRLLVTTTWTVTNSANNKTVRVKMGGATQFSSVAVTTTASLRQQVEIANRNSESSQVAMANNVGGFGISSGAVITAELATTVDRDLTITAQLANSGETITLESYVVELIPG